MPTSKKVVEISAVQVNSEYNKAKSSYVDSASHILECGRLLLDMKGKLGHGNFIPWVDAKCEFDRFFAGRSLKAWQKFEEKCASNAHLTEDDCREVMSIAWGNASSRHGGLTGQTEWYTPDDIMRRVRDVLGEIDLDPASNETANKVVRATTIYTEKTDGLDKSNPWFGKVFCNPPFSHPTCRFFSERMVDEYKSGNIDEAILLIQANSDLAYWHDLIRSSFACLPRGRIKFYHGSERNNPTLGQAIFHFGDSHDLFRERFADVGVIIRSVDDEL